MPRLGDPIDIEQIVSSANSLVGVIAHRPDALVDDNGSLIQEMYATLGAVVERTLGDNELVVAFGNCFLAKNDPWQANYTEILRGEVAGAVGKYDGLCSVFMDEAVEVDDSTVTHVIPALQLAIHDVSLEGVDLGSAQLYHQVAVPLIGQMATLFCCRFAA